MGIGNLLRRGKGQVEPKQEEVKESLEVIENRAIVSALMKSQAFIAFQPDGTIIEANDGFLGAMGYELHEVQGKHHAIFCDPSYTSSAEYKDFWASLADGQFFSGQFKRFGKGGREIHIQATYNPIKDESGAVVKVVKFASDITERVANVESLAGALQHLARADLTIRINEKFGKDLERLRTDFNGAVATIETAVALAKVGADAASQGTAEISHAADDLARRTEEQAARVSQSSSQLSEINEAIRVTANNAAATQKIVQASKADAKDCDEIVKQAVAAMKSIENSSSEISQIIVVIDEIAFQTNLLALNAGVEAARAGEAGRGFAVVASEVRALAQRSADAAKQIKDLIAISGERVNEGVERVEKTSTALEKINGGINEIAQKTEEIVLAAETQSDGLHKVSDLVGQIDIITQQNAAMVEETTAATRTLAGESAQLAATVNQFNANRSDDAHGSVRSFAAVA